MEIFLDTADINEIALYKDFIDGVTTNPSIIAQSKPDNFEALIKEICQLVSGPVSVEVISGNYNDMLEEGKQIAKIHTNVCVKLPCTFDGLRACKGLSRNGISTNLTLCFSPSQALFSAKCGATYVSPFIGRLEDSGHDGMSLVEEITNIFETHGYKTKVLAASVRSLQHLTQAAMLGAGAATLSPKIIKQCFQHPLTTNGLETFTRDWEKT